MTTGGWLTMIFSVGFVTVLFVYCVFRVLFGQRPEADLGHIEPVSEAQAEREQ